VAHFTCPAAQPSFLFPNSHHVSRSCTTKSQQSNARAHTTRTRQPTAEGGTLAEHCAGDGGALPVTTAAAARTRQGRVREHTNPDIRSKRVHQKADQIPRCPTTAPTKSRRGPRRHGPQPQPLPPKQRRPPQVRNPARRSGAGTRVAPGRRGSGDGRQSGTGPAPSAAPFLIAVFVPRAVGFNGVVTGRREWEQAAGLERSPRMRRRRSPHGHTRRPHT
jgi:hypothetical protein